MRRDRTNRSGFFRFLDSFDLLIGLEKRVKASPAWNASSSFDFCAVADTRISREHPPFSRHFSFFFLSLLTGEIVE